MNDLKSQLEQMLKMGGMKSLDGNDAWNGKTIKTIR